MTPRAFGRIAGLVCLLVLLFATACQGQMLPTRPVHATDARVSVERLAVLAGVSFCTPAGGFSFIRSGLSEAETAEVTAHEARHRTQYARFPDCAAFDRWYRTPKGVLLAEAEAFAAAWCVAATAGRDTSALRRDYVQRIHRFYLGGGTPIWDVAQAFDRFARVARCP